MAKPPAQARRKSALGLSRSRSIVAALAFAGFTLAGLAVAAPVAADVVEEEYSSLEFTVECDQYGGPGTLHYIIRDSQPDYQDIVVVEDSEGEVVHEQAYADATEFEDSVELAIGTYTIHYVATGETNPRYTDRQIVTITCPDLDVELSNPTCSTGENGSITVSLLGLIAGESYRWTAADAGGTFTAEGETADLQVAGLPPGNYYAYAEWIGQDIMFDWRAFAIEPCQPVIALTATQCTAAGGTASISVALSNLVDGVAYTVSGPGASTSEVFADVSGLANLTYPSVPAGMTSSVTIAGTWTVDEPYEEPPFIGGGDFTPLDTVALAASAESAPAPCPVAPAGQGPALAASGVDPLSTIVGGGTLMALGLSLLFVAVRRHPEAQSPGGEETH